MFNKLVSNLPYKPESVKQVVFYAKRLKDESAIRRIGLIFLSLGLIVQIFAMSLPAQAAVTGTSNDVIWGGIGYDKGPDPKANLLSVYDSDTDGHNTGIRELLNAFSITRQDIVNSYPTTINSSDHSLFSLGRDPHSSLDEPQVVDGVTYYLRPLYSWGDDVTYDVLAGERSEVNGDAAQKYFAIMFECGNIVIQYNIPPPAPPQAPPTPSLTIPNKVALSGNGLPAANSVVTRGETLGYHISWNNTGNGTATNVMLVDHIPPDTTYAGQGGYAGQLIGNQVIWTYPSMPGGATNWYENLLVTVANTATNGEQICNTAYLNSAQTPTLASQQVCFTVSVPQVVTPTTPATPNIVQSKSAANLTQNLSDAQTKPANPGDLIQYTLETTNTGDGISNNYVVTDNLQYVLQYSTMQSISDQGTVSNNVVTWPEVDIEPHTTITRTFEVKVDNPLPNPPLTTDTNSYNMKMTNIYGNSVVIPIATPAVLTTVAPVSNSLPNTGPGSSIFIIFVIVAIAGYFYSRSRLLHKEATIVVTEFTAGDL